MTVPLGASLEEVRSGAARPGGRRETIYEHLWGTEETRALFDDDGRTRIWLEIIVALAAEQAELGRYRPTRLRGSPRVEPGHRGGRRRDPETATPRSG